MIVLTVYVTENWLEHIQSQWEKSVQFPANYRQQPNISSVNVQKIQAINLRNEIVKWNKNWKWTKEKWSNNIFGKMTNDVK